MSDWYDAGKAEYIRDLAAATRIPREQVERIYAVLTEDSLIDYDIEKDFLYNRYVSEEEVE